MNNLGKAYVCSVIFTVAAPVASLYSTIAALVFVLLHVLVVGHFIANDAVSRGRSKAHQLWAFLGLLGVIIYNLAFARKS